jgi:transcriptional regulator GlxA family with amidase domain
MKNRDRPLAEVSSLLGFSAPSGFSRWYRGQFSVAPSVRRAAEHVQPHRGGPSAAGGRRGRRTAA